MIYCNKSNSYPLSSLTKVPLYGFWAEPHLIGHHREYLPTGVVIVNDYISLYNHAETTTKNKLCL